MYGMADIYDSPVAAENFGDDELAQIDAYLDDDDEEEFGGILGRGSILGIAITDKAKQNRMARILGRLREFVERDNKNAPDRAKHYAKALSRIDPIKKRKEGWISAEVQAWLDYAKTGDWEAVKEALGALDWAGEQSDEGDDAEEEGEVYTAAGTPGRRHRGRGRRLPPGFRPRGYSAWGAPRKAAWLARHPRAASIRLPIDPGPMPGRGRRGRPRAVPAPRVPRPGHRPVARAARAHPFKMAAARAAGRQFARSRFGLDGAVEEGVEEFGSLIGGNAFQNLQGADFLEHDSLFEDGIDDDTPGDDDLDDDEFGAYIAAYGDDGDDEFGAYIAAYGEDDDEFGAYIPQFGAMFKRDIEDRLEAARRRYERLRAKETDQTKVAEAYADYQRLVRAYAAASKRPTAQRKGPALATELGQPGSGPAAPEGYEEPQEQTFRLRGRVAATEDDEGDDDLEDGDEDFSIGRPA